MSNSNEIIKNRYYSVFKDDKPYAYFSVKKDFYTEGYLVNQQAVLVGYFNAYETFDVHVIDDADNFFMHYLNGISIVPSKTNDCFAVNGEINSSDYHLYKASLDEYCDHSLGEKIDCEIQIKMITDEEVIKNINYLIRNSIRGLTGNHRQYYDMLKGHRYGNLKGTISGIKLLLSEGSELGISDAAIEDLESYLEVLNPSLKSSNIKKNNCNRSQNDNKKKVKKKSKKRQK